MESSGLYNSVVTGLYSKKVFNRDLCWAQIGLPALLKSSVVSQHLPSSYPGADNLRRIS
jgi:hypothetical protein